MRDYDLENKIEKEEKAIAAQQHTPIARVMKKSYANEDVYYIGGFGQNRKAAEAALRAVNSHDTLATAIRSIKKHASGKCGHVLPDECNDLILAIATEAVTELEVKQCSK